MMVTRSTRSSFVPYMFGTVVQTTSPPVPVPYKGTDSVGGVDGGEKEARHPFLAAESKPPPAAPNLLDAANGFRVRCGIDALRAVTCVHGEHVPINVPTTPKKRRRQMKGNQELSFDQLVNSVGWKAKLIERINAEVASGKFESLAAAI